MVTKQASWDGLEELREPLRALLARHCRDESELDDVIQDTYLRAANYRERRPTVRHLRSWVVRIAFNVLSDHKRRGRRYGTAEEGLLEDLPDPRTSEPEEVSFRLGAREIDRETASGYLGEVLGELREEERSVLRSFYVGPGNCRLTATDCGIPPHLVKVRLFRARRRIVRLMRRRAALQRRVAEAVGDSLAACGVLGSPGVEGFEGAA